MTKPPTNGSVPEVPTAPESTTPPPPPPRKRFAAELIALCSLSLSTLVPLFPHSVAAQTPLAKTCLSYNQFIGYGNSCQNDKINVWGRNTSTTEGCRPVGRLSQGVRAEYFTIAENDSTTGYTLPTPAKICVEYEDTDKQNETGRQSCSTVDIDNCTGGSVCGGDVPSGVTCVEPATIPSGNIELNNTDALVISEGDTDTFTVKLDTEPAADVTVAVSSADPGAVTVSPASRTFTTANYSTPQSFTVTAVEDNDDDDESVVLTVSASGGIDADDVTKTVTVSETPEGNIELSAETLTVDEDGTGTFTVKLDTEPSEDVTVAITSDDTGAATVSPASLTFTDENYDETQTVTVTGVVDADNDDESVDIDLTATGGIVADPVDVDVTVDDKEPPSALVVSPKTLNVDEGGTATFTVKIEPPSSKAVSVNVTSSDTAKATASPASLTFLAGDAAAKTVTVNGPQDDDSLDENATLTVEATAGIDSEVEIPVVVADDDGTIVAPGTLNIPEGETRTFGVSISAAPRAAVTVSLSKTDANFTLSPTSLVFTVDNYAAAQSVTVSAPTDDDAVDETATLTLSATGGINAPDWTIAVRVDDAQRPGFDLSVAALDLVEGGQGSFRVRPATRPTADIVLDLVPSDASLTVDADPNRAGNQDTLAFTRSGGANAWNRYRDVSVFVAHDGDANDESFDILLLGNGGDYTGKGTRLAVSVADDDTPPPSAYTGGLVISPSGAFEIDEGGRAFISLRLDSEPSESVTVGLSTTNPDLSLSPTSLTFTPESWKAPRRVELVAGEDARSSDDSDTVVFSIPGRVVHSRALVILDNDAKLVRRPAGNIEVPEGGLQTLYIRLSQEPPEAVIVTLSSRNALVSLSPSTLTFSPSAWETEMAVQIVAGEDPDTFDDYDSVVIEATGGTSERMSITTTIVDNDDAPGGVPNWEVKSQALAIPSMSARDAATVRVRCKQDTPCAVFLDCSTQAGRVLQGHFPAIRAWATTTLVPGHIQRLIGAGSSWEGRLGCVLRSQANIGSQVWTRSGDRVLVNNGALIRSAQEGGLHRADIESIPSPDAFDESNIRIRCNAGENCRETSLVCYTDEGARYEANLGNIARASTRHLQSEELAERLGHRWQGLGLACEIRSQSGFTAQVLTRTGGGGALVNNSATGSVGN